jgi:hypothetical protein
MSFDDVARRMKGRPAPLPMIVASESNQFGLALLNSEKRIRRQRRITLTALVLMLGAAVVLVMQY